ncbi:hypothetical protein OU426_05115 [Frigidibacter sp. RF13]|uniref:hypothetical protein n=1 Tax=Frigidibacter sp. RF13 TaxID=2997340 RepID=UPI00226E8469|nr:hypothetical protein [Frigidibacter sp. RF13]MCY1126228.1 hypothetical protein [Frigidibacter sp. RF13]
MQAKLFALSLGFGGLILAADRAHGQQAPQCGSRETVIAQLADRFGESLQSFGLAANSAVIETYASVETGTWTILVTLADGRTCLLASGQNFERIDAPATPAGSPA